MKSLELLEKYPKATEVIKSWYLQKMLESLVDENIPEEFKEFMLEQGIETDKIAKMIDGSPRTLFDVFDDNEIFIQINVNGNFSYSINNGDVISGSWNKRVDAESESIKVAFDLINKKLEK